MGSESQGLGSFLLLSSSSFFAHEQGPPALSPGSSSEPDDEKSRKESPPAPAGHLGCVLGRDPVVPGDLLWEEPAVMHGGGGGGLLPALCKASLHGKRLWWERACIFTPCSCPGAVVLLKLIK